MEIEIAGAGAGKTTKIAQSIISDYKHLKHGKIIFCITFTNNAVSVIKSILTKNFGNIPENIKISTIHSFLYNEFIKPYYWVMFGKTYRHISVCSLPENNVYANKQIKELEGHGILHQTKIPMRAKWIVVKKSNDKKETKEKRQIVLKTFSSYCEKIYIDEAQDIDGDMKDIFSALDSFGINIFLIGDPNQDLRGQGKFRNLITEQKTFVKYNNICHRCPNMHLKYSNMQLVDDEKQNANDKNRTGKIELFFESEQSVKKLIEYNKFDLVYISKREDGFETHKIVSEDEKGRLLNIYYAFCEYAKKTMPINDALRKSFYNQLYKLYKECQEKDKGIILRKFLNGYNLRLPTETYAIIISNLPDKVNSYNSSSEDVFVHTIDSIKGMEGENCLFILTTDLAEYLFLHKLDDNKIKHKLYVALTRSKKDLTILVRKNVEEKYTKEKIINFFES